MKKYPAFTNKKAKKHFKTLLALDELRNGELTEEFENIAQIWNDAYSNYFVKSHYVVQYGRRVGPHSYFKGLAKVLEPLSATYDPEDTTKPFKALHIDLAKFSTSERWGKVPHPVREEFLRKSKIIDDIKDFKPNLIIFGVEITKLVHLLPGVAWIELGRFEKTNAVAQVNYAWYEIESVGKILLIQTTPCPFPFLRLTNDYKLFVGKKIKQLLEW